MLPHLDPTVPVAVISNFVEAHYEFLSRAGAQPGAQSSLDQEAYHADRTLLWAGDPKLVIVSLPIPHCDYVCDVLGYHGTRHISPDLSTYSLSQDVLRESWLVDELLRYSGVEKRIQLVPYATTPEFLRLVDVLQSEYGLEVLLPECPAPEAMWLRDSVDTKSGFHHLAAQWLSSAEALLPDAYVCDTADHAQQVVRWFGEQGRSCITKPDTGESGLGVQVFRAGNTNFESKSDGRQADLQVSISNPYWGDEPIVVEEFIGGNSQTDPLSPSVEVFVPALGTGEPTVTYVSEQLFQGYGKFSGVLVSPDQRGSSWYSPCVDSSLQIGRRLQEHGYVGHFDIDAIVDGDGRPYLLELNARRTGGTHVHDFGVFYFGPDYAERVALLSWEGVECAPIGDWRALCGLLGDLLFPIDAEARGVIVTIASALVKHQFGVLIVARDRRDALGLQAALFDRLRLIHAAAQPTVA